MTHVRVQVGAAQFVEQREVLRQWTGLTRTEPNLTDVLEAPSISEAHVRMYRASDPGVQSSPTSTIPNAVQHPTASERLAAPFADAWRFLIAQLGTSSARQAATYLREIDAHARDLATGQLPSLTPYYDATGSLVLEWILPDRRLGFAFEENPIESSWFFARAGKDSASGYLMQTSAARLVAAFLKNQPA